MLDSPSANSFLCVHCKAPIPGFRRQSEYCCSGCQSAAELLKNFKLDSYYTLQSQESFSEATPVRPQGGSFEYFDDPDFQRSFVKSQQGAIASAALQVDGIHCVGCLWVLENLSKVFPGTQESRVNLSESSLELHYDASKVKLSQVAIFIDRLGYRISPDIAVAPKGSNRSGLMRIGVAVVCAMNIQMVAVSLYQGYFSGIPNQYADLFAWSALLLTIPVIFYSAKPIILGAINSLKLGAPALDVPLALGILAGFIYSVFVTFTDPILVYFDTISSLVALILVGRYVQEAALKHARRLTTRALRFLPERAKLITDSGIKEVSASMIKMGDQILLDPGERLPTDGEIILGSTLLDESLLSGESSPRAVGPGTLVFAGTLNLQSQLKVKITAPANESRVALLLQSLRQSGSKARLVQLIDRISRIFVVIVLILSAITFSVWVQAGIPIALHHTIALLIVTCPCALALGIPLALGVTIGRAAQRGIIIKSDDAFERLLEATTVVLDKTGTITQGELSIAEIILRTSIQQSEAEELITALAAVNPSHPISRALLNDLSVKLERPNFASSRYEPGAGVEAFDANGTRFRLGSSQWTGGVWTGSETVVHLFKDEQELATIKLFDELRPEAIDTVKKLGKRFEVYLLSGDSDAATKNVGSLVGILGDHCIGAASPEKKREFVGELPGKVIMIGDGFNDAVAMQQAFIAIGLKGSIASTIQSSDIFISSGSLSGVTQVLSVATKVKKLVLAILVVSLIYNILGAAFAMAGYIHPLAAAILMPVSSLTTVLMAVYVPCFSKSPKWK